MLCGVVGAGNWMGSALSSAPCALTGCAVVGCLAGSLEEAESFALEMEIGRAFGRLEDMLAERGAAAIVHNASPMGLVSYPAAAASCASKAGFVFLTRSMALEGAADNIRVNRACPGIIRTPMPERRFAMQADRKAACRATVERPPIKHLGRPEEVAASIAYLASDEAGVVTGSAHTIDGGMGAA
jgi:NAD(P)-dependent dehydrogenase (short-subunit alcohol dehydrogenase family)